MKNTEKNSGQKRWKALTSILLLVTLVFAGFIAIAAEYGTSDDPLVSLSYINNVLAPQISEKVDDIVEEKANSLLAELESKVSSVEGELDDKVASYANENTELFTSDEFINSVAEKVSEKVGGTAAPSTTFQRVDLKAGQTLSMGIGCEVLLRLGTANCVSSGTPGLIDMSDSTEIANGKALLKNHLYLCTVDGGRGVKAVSNITVFVRGTHSIS